MIHLTVTCSWCEKKVDLSGVDDNVIVGDELPVVQHRGEAYAFCSPECVAKAVAPWEDE